MFQKVSSHPASLEEPEPAARVPVQAPEREPERVQLQQEPVLVQETLQQEPAAQAPERALPWSTETSLPEIAPASPA